MAKYIMDNVWGDIVVTPLARKFLDVPEFQRMRFMKQLGPCNFVYTCAEASRFAHSLGVYHLARQLTMSLQRKHPDIVKDIDVELVSIAALYHDIGHACFSHTFDKITGSKHEERSKGILELVVKKYDIPLTPHQVHMMQEMIEPTVDGGKWYNQIVSNGDVDVDRMDYIVRDSKATGVTVTLNDKSVLKLINRAYIEPTLNELVYPPSVSYVIRDLLDSRKYMYERVYCHPTAVKIEKLIMMAIKDELKDSLDNVERFLSISDSILLDVYNKTKDKEKRGYIEKIFTRDLDDNTL